MYLQESTLYILFFKCITLVMLQFSKYQIKLKSGSLEVFVILESRRFLQNGLENQEISEKLFV